MKARLVLSVSLASSIAALFLFRSDLALSQWTAMGKPPASGFTATDPGVPGGTCDAFTIRDAGGGG